MSVKLLTEHHLEFLSLKEGCTGSSESTLVKMSNCWKSHAAAHMRHMRLIPMHTIPAYDNSESIENVNIPCRSIRSIKCLKTYISHSM